MSRGQHLARCSCCGSQWIGGDCITYVCHECEAKGHTGLGCQKCWDEMQARLAASRVEHGLPAAEPIPNPFGKD